MCHENSDIINTAYAALSPADVTNLQTVPLSNLGLKRGSFVYAAWPEDCIDDDLSEQPIASDSSTAEAGRSESKAADPVAFGIRNAAPVAGAQ